MAARFWRSRALSTPILAILLALSLLTWCGPPAGAEPAWDDLVQAENLAASDPGNTQAQFNLAQALIRVGDTLAAEGRPAEAIEHFRRALGILQLLGASDPANTASQRAIVAAHTKIGSALSAQGDLAGANDNYERCGHL